jgi:hypothetical protein
VARRVVKVVGLSEYRKIGESTDGIISDIRWEDVRVPANAIRVGSDSPAVWSAVTGGLYTWGFPGNTETQVYFNVQLPHAYKFGSTIYPHIHWSASSTDTGTVRFGLEYIWQDIHGVFPAAQTIYTSTAAAPGVALRHEIRGFTPIASTGIDGVSSMLICRLFRDTDNDDFTGTALFLEFDIHIQMDTIGSAEETSK